MIVVRDIFQLKFGKSREAMALLEEGLPIIQSSGHQPDRLLTDMTGTYYTVVMESSFPTLADYESSFTSSTSNPKWREWYSKFVPLVETGRREIFTVVKNR